MFGIPMRVNVQLIPLAHLVLVNLGGDVPELPLRIQVTDKVNRAAGDRQHNRHVIPNAEGTLHTILGEDGLHLAGDSGLLGLIHICHFRFSPLLGNVSIDLLHTGQNAFDVRVVVMCETGEGFRQCHFHKGCGCDPAKITTFNGDAVSGLAEDILDFRDIFHILEYNLLSAKGKGSNIKISLRFH